MIQPTSKLSSQDPAIAAYQKTLVKAANWPFVQEKNKQKVTLEKTMQEMKVHAANWPFVTQKSRKVTGKTASSNKSISKPANWPFIESRNEMLLENEIVGIHRG